MSETFIRPWPSLTLGAALVAAAAPFLTSCGSSASAPPEITALTPEQGFNDRMTRVTVTGAFVISNSFVDYRSEESSIEIGLTMKLGEVRLEALEVVREGEVRASVPPGLEPDTRYDLTLVDAEGGTASKEDAFLSLRPPSCGDGRVVAGVEECDDGNTVSDDGCSSACLEEDGWLCIGSPSRCERR